MCLLVNGCLQRLVLKQKFLFLVLPARSVLCCLRLMLRLQGSGFALHPPPQQQQLVAQLLQLGPEVPWCQETQQHSTGSV